MQREQEFNLCMQIFESAWRISTTKGISVNVQYGGGTNALYVFAFKDGGYLPGWTVDERTVYFGDWYVNHRGETDPQRATNLLAGILSDLHALEAA